MHISKYYSTNHTSASERPSALKLGMPIEDLPLHKCAKFGVDGSKNDVSTSISVRDQLSARHHFAHKGRRSTHEQHLVSNHAWDCWGHRGRWGHDSWVLGVGSVYCEHR